ncbi:cellulase family glycosylhydrolase [Gryllotalpicola kribbensis]|uniref:Cellulase family glycosylhydrolase n=1 Tax=Gryllotalpicola kribbensis TaxID=993084 RepID=A0ABP8AHC8_9MICO
MRFGVNYTPSAGWFHSWLEFDADAARRDLDGIASLGVDHVRVFPLWGVVQPNRGLIRRAALDDIGALIDVAGEFGLDVNVDAIQGHLSSFDFLPAWLATWHRRNMFTDPEAIDGELHYVRALAELLASRPNVLGLTLGNELNQFAAAPHPDPHPVSAGDAHAWLARLTAAARESAPGLVTHSMYDAGWYDDTQPFGPEHAAAHGDATVVHSWVFNGAAQRYGALAPGSVRHAEYLSLLAAAWNEDAARPVWLQEVGAPTNVVPVADAPEFLEATVRHAASVARMWGITWWCSHDVSRELADFPELEYDLGLFDNDRRIKPTGRRFAELVRELRTAPPAAPAPIALLLDDTAEGYRASCAPGGEFFEAWLRAAEAEGRGPQILLASRAADEASLAARGITRVLADCAELPR